ncbi:type II toxin-antitoxin system HipA family toxin [Verminephrobacter aporrectodeae]|uniref:type II toxin-antitoxin system HipA family toxin n=1 Tax=Verminephrobacter aporrectodeae TaxID=1110389 RepID=UPI000237541F|nr:type II toxin-antitoxin system HipA family toxin [Verminephrobacter aporrectodeae]
MQYRALHVFLGTRKRFVGQLYQYGTGRTAITRLVPDPDYWSDGAAPVFSQNARVADAHARAMFLAEYIVQPFFNGEGENLPIFFQNLLPEGLLRRHLEEIGNLDKGDDFGLLSLCGTDLPGAVCVEQAPLDKQSVARVVTQNNDTLEPTVTPVALPEATSLSGVQPKLSLVQAAGRYVARTKNPRGVHIIAKLPTVEYPLLPRVEELSMQLAAVAGVHVCEVELAPLENIDADQPFVLGEGKQFLAVRRFDRDGTKHIHCEDFAQILGVPPEQKYSHPLATYSTMLRILVQTPELGLEAGYEMLRRIVVNDLLGNFDGHLKNYGLLYRDGSTPELSPAYDVVAYAAYLSGRGHALGFTPDGPRHARVSPQVIRRLCNEVPGLLEPMVNSIVKETVRKAYAAWPDMIAASTVLDEQKARLLKHFEATPAIESLRRRALRAGG